MTGYIQAHTQARYPLWRRLGQRAAGVVTGAAGAVGVALVFVDYNGRPEQSLAGAALVVAAAFVHCGGVATFLQTFPGWSWRKAGAVGLGCAGIVIVVCYLLPLILGALAGFGFGAGDDDDDDNDGGGAGDGGGSVTASTPRRETRASESPGLCPSCGRASGGGLCPLCRP